MEQGLFRTLFGQLIVKAFGDKTAATAGDVDHFADQVGIDPLAEIVEIQVDIIDAGAEFGGKIIAQVFGIQMIQIGSGFDEGAARFGHFFAVHG